VVQAVFLVGDCEFGPVETLKQLDLWHLVYVFASKNKYFASGWISPAMENLRQFLFQKAASKFLAGSRLLDCSEILLNQFAGSLADR